MKRRVVLIAVLVALAGAIVVLLLREGAGPAGPTALVERHGPPAPPHLEGRPMPAAAAPPGPGPAGAVSDAASSHTFPLYEGRVVDEDGLPVAGAEVKIGHVLHSGTIVRGWGTRFTRKTNADGVFAIIGSRSRPVRLAVSATPRTSASLPIEIRDPDDPVVLRVARRHNLGGRVLDVEARGVAGVPLRITWRDGDGLNLLSGEEGRFEVRVPPGASGLRVAAGVLEGATRDEDMPLGDVACDVPVGTLDLVLRLTTPVVLEGRVFGADGSLLASGSVGAVPDDADPKRPRLAVGITPATGHFRIARVRAIRWRLVAVPADGRYATSDPALYEAPHAGVVLLCPPAAALKGRVRGEDVTDFRVVCIEDDCPWGDGTREARVGEDGRFEVPHLRPALHRVYLWRPGDPRMADLPGVLPGADELVVDLRPGRSIEGRFAGGVTHDRLYVEARHGRVVVTAKVELDSTFRLLGLSEGEWTLELRERTGGLVLSADVSWVVEAGARDVVLGKQ